MASMASPVQRLTASIPAWHGMLIAREVKSTHYAVIYAVYRRGALRQILTPIKTGRYILAGSKEAMPMRSAPRAVRMPIGLSPMLNVS
jgi:hypothetical protein